MTIRHPINIYIYIILKQVWTDSKSLTYGAYNGWTYIDNKLSTKQKELVYTEELQHLLIVTPIVRTVTLNCLPTTMQAAIWI